MRRAVADERSGGFSNEGCLTRPAAAGPTMVAKTSRVSETNLRSARRLTIAAPIHICTMAELTKLEAEIERYRLLGREVTDPLAMSLISVLIAELEADLQQTSAPVSFQCETLIKDSPS